jgi:hypothetical protein
MKFQIKGALDSQPQVIVYQLLAHGQWFSPASSTTKTDRHDIAEILQKVAINTKNQSINHRTYITFFVYIKQFL